VDRGPLLDGFGSALPLLPGTLAFGLSFGVLARASGLDPVLAAVMSMTSFSGGAQVTAVGVLAAGGGPFLAAGAGALVNARYALLGATIAPYLQGGLLRRLALAQALVDESWALATRDGGFRPGLMVGAAALLWAGWVASTLAGALGAALVDPRRLGLDAGHMFLGGCDPVDVVHMAPGRIRHVHLKEVDGWLGGMVAAGELEYVDAVRRGLFQPAGPSVVDVKQVVGALRETRYKGWFVVEQDRALVSEPPAGNGPAAGLERALAGVS